MRSRASTMLQETINDDLVRPTPCQLPAAARGGAPAAAPGESRRCRRLPARQSQARLRQVRRLDSDARREGHAARPRQLPRPAAVGHQRDPGGRRCRRDRRHEPGGPVRRERNRPPRQAHGQRDQRADPGDGADFRPAEADHHLSQHQVLRHPRGPDRARRIERRHDQSRRRGNRPDERRDQAHQLRGARPDADCAHLRREGEIRRDAAAAADHRQDGTGRLRP